MDQLRWQVARGAEVTLRLQSLLRFAGLPLVETTVTAGALARLQLLAAPVLVRPDATVVPLERKDAALLALLALDGPTSRSRAAALLWPDADAEKARNSLRQRLFRLRRTAGVELIEPDESLRLADGVEHNLGSPAQRLADDPTAAAGDLLGACVYDDCPELEDWVRIAREHWRAVRRDALAELAAKREADGHIAQALVYAERLLAEDPVSEQAHRLAMRLHYRRGDRAAALAAYDRCRSALRREVATEPSAETLALHQLILRADPLSAVGARSPRPTAIVRPPRLIGRDAEWRAVGRAWEAGLPVLITGDAGAGKSRLLGDFAQAHALLVVGARPGDARVPYALLARLLRASLRTEGDGSVIRLPDGLDDFVKSELARVLPELGTAPVEPLVEARFRSAVVQTLTRRHATGLAGVAVDDLHFADESTLELLPQVVIPGFGWLGAVRGAECPAPIAAWQRAEGGSRLIEVPLGPLGEDAVRELLESLAPHGVDAIALAGAIARHAGGNPFFVLETLNVLIEAGNPEAMSNRLPTPVSVGTLIDRRLAQLSTAALKLARVAALSGTDFSAALAAHVLQTRPLDLAEAWGELEMAQVIRGQTFAHDLIFEATLRSVPIPIAQLLHAEIAGYLESHGGEPARIAGHWLEAQQWNNAGVQFQYAAEHARGFSQRQEEARLLQLAVECFERAGERSKAFAATSALVIPSVLVAAARSPLDWIERMLTLATTEHEQAETLRLKAIVLQARGEHAAVIETMQSVLVIARNFEDRRISCAATGTMAVAMASLGRGEEAVAAMAPFRPWVLAHQDEDCRVEYFAELGNVLDLSDRREEAIEPLQIALASARLSGTVTHQVSVLRILAHVSMYLGRSGDALNYATTAIAARAALGEARGVSLVTDMYLGWCLRDLGRFVEAKAALEAAIEAFYSAGIHHWHAFSENLLAELWLQLGQPARAMKALTKLAPGVPSFIVALRHLVKAQIARIGRSSFAEDIELARQTFARGHGRTAFRLLVDIDAARALDADDAAARLQTLADEARRTQNYSVRITALARAAQRLAETAPARAAPIARKAIEDLKRTDPLGIYRPEISLISYEAFNAAGAAPEALQSLRDGSDWIRLRALPNVPDEFKDSFLSRNPVNRVLLTTADRRLR